MENITLDSYISDNKKDDKVNRPNKNNRNDRNRDNRTNNRNNNNNNRGGNNRFNRRGGDSRRQNNNNQGYRNNNRRDNYQKNDSSDWNDNKLERRQRKQSYGEQDEKRQSGRFVVLENLHYSVTEEELLEHASKYGEVIECKIFWDDNGRSEEKAIIQFEDAEDAKKAIEELQDAIIEDQALKAHFASNDDVNYITKKTKKIQKSNKSFNRRR